MMSFWFVLIAASTAAEEPEPDMRCGAYCLYVSLKALDIPVGSYAELEQKLGGPTRQGYSLGHLAEAARGYGAHPLGVSTTVENLALRDQRFACIARIDDAHFLNVGQVDGNVVHIINAPSVHTVPIDTFRTTWDGTALLIGLEPLTPEEDLKRPFSGRGILIALSVAGAVVLLVVSRGFHKRRR
jgi:ABC-type bacteriocin/lantibiotic exporter with double-glycine peptidase domain